MRRLRLVPAGDEPIDRPEPALGRHDEVRPTVSAGDRSVRRGDRLERSHDRRPDADDAPAPSVDAVDEPSGLGRHAVALGNRRLVPLGGGDAGVEQDRSHDDAASDKPREELRGERPARARHLGAPRRERVHVLVRLERPLARDVAVPNRMAMPAEVALERLREIEPGEPEPAAACVSRHELGAAARRQRQLLADAPLAERAPIAAKLDEPPSLGVAVRRR
jgi:hypothetical protein